MRKTMETLKSCFFFFRHHFATRLNINYILLLSPFLLLLLLTLLWFNLYTQRSWCLFASIQLLMCENFEDSEMCTFLKEFKLNRNRFDFDFVVLKVCSAHFMLTELVQTTLEFSIKDPFTCFQYMSHGSKKNDDT